MNTFTETFAREFKKGYAYKMGGTQTIVMPNGQEFYFDDREYYGGRGAKYNSSIRHDNLGRVEVSKKEVAAIRKIDRERAKAIREGKKQKKEAAERYAANKANGVYGLKDAGWCLFVELSDEESITKIFDVVRLAATLHISVEDAELLNSEGKTYVFARQANGRIIELYHASLSCNYLSISVSYPSAKEMAEFNHDKWAAAPYASRVGMTDNKNHFVC